MPPHPPDPLSGPPLARLRLARGWSQSRLAAELCTAAGVPTLSRHEISRWERRRRTPGRFWHAWLATVLGVPTNPLLDPPVAALEAPAGHPPLDPSADLSAGLTLATGGDTVDLAGAAGDRDRGADRCRPASARPPARAAGRAATRRYVGGSARRDLTH